MSEETSSQTDTPSRRLGIYLISPSGAVQNRHALTLARRRLYALGFPTTLDRCALAVHERFAGTDAQRLGCITRALKQPHPIVMITRGGYGLSRLLPQIDWRAVADSGKTFVGFSDFTAFNLALLARTGAHSFSGPAALTDFGNVHLDVSMRNMFTGMMRDRIAQWSFSSPGADPVEASGVLWGGNLAMVTSLLGTPYMPKVRGGILFLEDVGESPYRIERMLAQLWQAGILERQKAILLGQFTKRGNPSEHAGHDLDAVVRWLRATVRVPVVPDFPYGHVTTKMTVPVGARVNIVTKGGEAFLRVNRRLPRGRVTVDAAQG